MILDSLKNIKDYSALSPYCAKAIEFIQNCDLASLPLGRNEIYGDAVFANVMEVKPKTRTEAMLEVHRKYIDIQLLLDGPEELFGWSEKPDCVKPEAEFDEAKDVQFFTDVPQCFYSVKKGQFSILFPEDGHAPMLGEGHVKKCIFKIAL